ncbi:MAG: sulfotransferase, partial [Streptosporangiaceae bacterium]
MELRRNVNAVLTRAIGYQLSRPPAGRAWRYPSPRRLNKLLSHTTGYQLSRPLARRERQSTPSPGSRLLTAPVFILSAARSGSTLMRVILGSHSQLYAPPELPLKHLGARADTPWIRASIEALGLTAQELDHMLWDRVLADTLERSGKPT